ncbi:molybdenum cofactor guanylyltransferase [Microbacterium sp. USHLN186]|uniref:molybdenum cofactor guanylyltransferase n=1 Tax=Microbacterium sp. USHLN186 TaxID=3081286 RepID=UPI003019FB5C
MTPSPSPGGIVLVGGRSRRMGGGAKPLLEVGGRTLLNRMLTALQDAGSAPIIAVGPLLDATADVRWVREDPPFTGPVAAIAAALAALTEPIPPWMLVLAGDLPHAARLVPTLIGATASASADDDAAVFTAHGHPQWLAGAYRTRALREALRAQEGALDDASCRAVLGGLRIAWLSDDDGVTADIDTPADLARMRAVFEEER